MTFLLLGGYAHAALAATQESAKSFRLFLGRLRVSASGKDNLNLVEEVLVYERRMFALVYFAAIAKMTVVKRIDENESRSVFVERIAVKAPHAVFVEETGDVLKAGVSLRVKLKGGSYRFGLLPVNDNGFISRVVKITDGSYAGKLSAPCFVPQSPARVGA